MACFIVPMVEAVVTTVIAHEMKKQESKKENHVADGQEEGMDRPFSQKLKGLSNLLWGGSVLLAFEHVWHGEVVPWFPYLTAIADSADTVKMLHEMSTAGVIMAVSVTAVWGIGCLIVKLCYKQNDIGEKNRNCFLSNR